MACHDTKTRNRLYDELSHKAGQRFGSQGYGPQNVEDDYRQCVFRTSCRHWKCTEEADWVLITFYSDESADCESLVD